MSADDERPRISYSKSVPIVNSQLASVLLAVACDSVFGQHNMSTSVQNTHPHMPMDKASGHILCIADTSARIRSAAQSVICLLLLANRRRALLRNVLRNFLVNCCISLICGASAKFIGQHYKPLNYGVVAEWLRRRPRKSVLFGVVSSNLAHVECFLHFVPFLPRNTFYF